MKSKTETTFFCLLAFVLLLIPTSSKAASTSIGIESIPFMNMLQPETSMALVDGKMAVSFSRLDNTDGFWFDDGRGGGVADDGIPNGTEIRTINFSLVNSPRQWLTDYQDRVAMVYVGYSISNPANVIGVWIDDGLGVGTAGDGVSTSGERRTINASNIVGSYLNISFDVIQSYLTVLYTEQQGSGNPRELKMWMDDGNGGGTASDGVPTTGEIRVLRTAISDYPVYTHDLVEVDGHLGVVIGEKFEYNEDSTDKISASTCYLWVDDGNGGGTADDHVINGAELRTISNNYAGFNVSATMVGNVLGVSFLELTNPPFQQDSTIRLWLDNGNGGGVANDLSAAPGEINDIDIVETYIGTSGLESILDTAVIANSGVNAPPILDWPTLKVWIDDGNGGGTAHDGIENGSEILTFESAVGSNISLLAYESKLGVAYGYLDFGTPTNNEIRLRTESFTPVINTITPNQGFALGGTAVSISGDYFTPGADVQIGGNPVLNLSQSGSSSLSFLTPAGNVGMVDVVVTNTDGVSVTATNGYTYLTNPNQPPTPDHLLPLISPCSHPKENRCDQ